MDNKPSPLKRPLNRAASMSNVLHEPSALEQKMYQMREKFQMLKLIDESKANEEHNLLSPSQEQKTPSATPSKKDDAAIPLLQTKRSVKFDFNLDDAVIAPSIQTPTDGDVSSTKVPPKLSRASTAPNKQALSLSSFTEEISPRFSPRTSPRATSAGERWGKLRKVVLSEGGTSILNNSSVSDLRRPATAGEESPRAQESPRLSNFRTLNAQLESEDMKLNEIWGASDFVKPFILSSSQKPDVSLPSDEMDVGSQFSIGVDDIKIQINKIPEEVVTKKKEAVEKAMLDQHRKTLDDVKKMKIDTVWRENLARKRIEEMEKDARDRLNAERKKMMELAIRKETAIGREFRKAREELEAGIQRQQGAVKEHFGKILIYNESLSRRFNVFTKMFPQPVEFRIHIMRAIKNKLPKGAYVMMLSQYESLGGHPLTWSQIGPTGIGEIRPGVTRIVKHMGRFFDRTLRFEDSCFALCPPRPQLKPGFIFVLELFQLASYKNPIDKVVAWTAVPMSFENMSLVEGKLKLPMLRGEHSPSVRHFKAMEHLMAEDLSNWLCNVYVEVRHISLNELGATPEMLKSADFDLDYLNKVVVPNSSLDNAELVETGVSDSPLAAKNMISQNKDDSVVLDAEINRKEGSAGLQVPVDKGIFRRKLNITTDLEAGNNHVEGVDVSGDESKVSKPHRTIAQQLLSFVGINRPESSTKPFNKVNSSVNRDQSFLQHRQTILQKWKDNIRNKLPKQKSALSEDEKETELRERGYNLQDEVFLHPQQRGKLAGVETVDSKENRKWAGAGLEGKIVRRWQSEGPRFDTEAIDLPPERHSPSPKHSPRGSPRGNSPVHFNFEGFDKDWEDLRDQREMVEYSMSLSADPTRKKNLVPGSKARSKIRYLSLELFGDLVPYLFGSFEFYMTVFMYVFTFWMRIYVHYLAQYLFVLAQNTPVYGFDLRILFVSFRYSSESLSTAVEVGIVAIGPIACICVFILFLVFGNLFYNFAGFLPDAFSKMFAYFGVATVLDPLLIFLIDMIYHHYDCSSVSEQCKLDYTSGSCDCYSGDFIKLWSRMLRVEGSGITGAFITAMIYLASGVLSLLFLYQYLVYVHRDGRILDLWRRVNAPHDEFFIPDDFEVSGDELRDIIVKAKGYRGMAGTKRKLVIEEGIERDPQDKNFMGKFQRFFIYEVDPDGNQTALYRQFLMDNSGKILELFQDGGAAKSTNIFKMKVDETEGNNGDDDGDDQDHQTSEKSKHDFHRTAENENGSHRSKGSRGSNSHHDNVGMEGELDNGVPDVRLENSPERDDPKT